MSRVDVRVQSWTAASATEMRTGLLGYIAVEYGHFLIDGITLRRTADGRFALSFPARTDRSGRRHSYIRPLDNEARRAIETAVLSELRQWEGAP